MKEVSKTLRLLIAAAIVFCICFTAIKLMNGPTTTVTVSEATLKEALTPIAELCTYEYEYTTMEKYESYSNFYGWKVPFTTSKFIVTYDGVIKAGFDFESMRIEVNDHDITIVLPNIVIISHEIDFVSMQVYDAQTSIFNPITITDTNSFYADNSKRMESKAIDSGLLGKAKTNAISLLKGFVQNFVGEDYTITIK